MTTARVTIGEIAGGKTRMSIESEFPTVEAMEQLAAMGMEEGLTQAVSQIDAILAEDRPRLVDAGDGQRGDGGDPRSARSPTCGPSSRRARNEPAAQLRRDQ